MRRRVCLKIDYPEIPSEILVIENLILLSP